MPLPESFSEKPWLFYNYEYLNFIIYTITFMLPVAILHTDNLNFLKII